MPTIRVTKDYEAEANKFRQLARLDSTGDKARTAFAAAIGEPILQNIKKQSSIQDIYVEDFIPPGEQARYDMDITFTPNATDEFSGAAEDLDVEEVSGLGSKAKSQMLESDFLYVPKRKFEIEAGFDLDIALQGRFSWAERLRDKISEAITKKVESIGWAQIQSVVGDASFPATQKVSISAGNPGAGMFSKQLFVQGLKAMRDAGMIRNYPGAQIALYMTTQSLSEFEDWDVSTEGIDVSTQADLGERTKDAIVDVDPKSYDASYRGTLLKSLTTLASGDVVASHDYVYMFLITPNPVFFVRPVFATSNGQRIQILEDQQAAYDDDSFRMKVRYAENYKCLDCRNLIVLDITR